MPSDKVRLYFKILSLILPFGWQLLTQRLAASIHKLTWSRGASPPKNVVVIGGSFAGIEAVKWLSETLPSCYRVVLVERNSHFHWVFNFPRFSVVPGWERKAFMPYDFLAPNGPAGILHHVRGEFVSVSANSVTLASGETIDYEYLVVATGAQQPSPARLKAREIDDGCQELQQIQQAVIAADKIAVVGGGAVGVELATDIKSFYPDKSVTLLHSRSQLLNNFSPKLRHHVMAAHEKLGIRTVLQQRPKIVYETCQGSDEKASVPKLLKYNDGRVEEYNLIIPCTGQKPNSDIIAAFAPQCIDPQTRQILVSNELRLTSTRPSTGDGDVERGFTFTKTPANVFAMGNVALTGGPHMARAGLFQANVVASNIVNLIRGTGPMQTYTPRVDCEGSIKLTLGRVRPHFSFFLLAGERLTGTKQKDYAWFTCDSSTDPNAILVEGHDGTDDLDIAMGWRLLGLSYRPDY